ncbi:MAG: Sortase family protein [Candidatus Daviesbacteria bacterium GW2011_GWA1_41_61]|nr:MAG: Sortase family protein [Candidatus Daviesbacteria bacterium GW2011_GWC1_40_9]KKR93352.1 MAG: Sortase family protein [Candidatus Daviesbacteria bacterium GW2011_GWB1_41_15]KKS15099.1 MAG: Sortase family protein [Candidatus Daviesbacteria bacterium GW2011_GWA1_41_61]
MYKKVFSLLSLGLGVFVLMQVIMPLLAYQIWEMTDYQQNKALVSAYSKENNVLGISIKDVESDFPAFNSTLERQTGTAYSEFKISIPSIKLTDIKVAVDSNNFEQNLAHLPGSALPGEKGNVFITGHSSLPQLFRPGNFKAIFANLPKVKKGDQVIVEAGEQKFEYQVEGLKVVNPDETWVINPPDTNGRYLSLMTCVPPGLYLKRLIVLAKLES